MTAIGLSDLYFSRHFFPPAVPHLVAHSVVPSIRSDFLSNGAQNACDASCNARLERLFVEGIGMLWAHLRRAVSGMNPHLLALSAEQLSRDQRTR